MSYLPEENHNNLRPAPAWVRVASGTVRRLPAGRYRVMNSLPRPGMPFLAQMPEALGGYRFECDLRDCIAREVCFTGQYEPQETALLRTFLQPGQCFVDVGANWGYHTLLAAHLVGTAGRVLSCEPDPRLFPVLRRNVERNKLAHVTALQVAAADANGTLKLAGFAAAQGNFGVSRLDENASGADVFEVAARPLDELLAEQKIERVDLLKMDIEGAEGLALEGLRENLQSGRVRRLLLELHPAELAQRGANALEIVETLLQTGYRGWKIAHSLSATRRLAYSTKIDPTTFLHPFDAREPLDDWPHFLWLAEGVEPTW